MNRRGEITIFLGLILLSVWAILCGLTESARTAGARCYLRHGMNAAIDSLMSQYHRQLWEQYRLFGLEYGTGQELEQEFSEFLEPYLEAENWYPMDLKKVEKTELVSLTDRNGQILEDQILDYMRYGLLNVRWEEMSEEEAGELLRSVREAAAVEEVAEQYEGHSGEALKLEKCLESIDRCLNQQKQQWEEGGKMLEDLNGDAFIRRGQQVIRQLERVPSLVERYEEEAEALGEKLAASRNFYKQKRSDISGQIASCLEEEMAVYETYISRDGERRKEVEGLKEASSNNCQYVQNAIEEAREVQEFIDQWEPDEDGEEELDEEELWEPVIRKWDQYPHLTIGVRFGVEDQEKGDLLEQVKTMLSGKLLPLVLPEGRQASGRRPDLSGAPSVLISRDEKQSAASLLERLMIGEYILRFFNRYDEKRKDPGSCDYEMEYILFGYGGDQENLEEMALRLLTLRQGMNLIHIFSDSQKREAARNLAAAIVGGIGILPLAGVVAFLIMGVWALGEAFWDVRALFDGGKIPLVKTRDSWQLSLENLLDLGKKGALSQEGKAESSGLDYRGYGRILLFLTHGSGTDYRVMDLIQSDLRQKQEEFRMDRCAHQVDMKAGICGKHVFFSLGLWKSFFGSGDTGYELDFEVSGSYL